MSEPLIRALADLPPAEPNPARGERIRLRCRARLARPAPRASAVRAAIARAGTVPIWQPLVTVLGIAYLAEVIVQALNVYGLP